MRVPLELLHSHPPGFVVNWKFGIFVRKRTDGRRNISVSDKFDMMRIRRHNLRVSRSLHDLELIST